jgi:hypothetical protein
VSTTSNEFALSQKHTFTLPFLNPDRQKLGDNTGVKRAQGPECTWGLSVFMLKGFW